MPSPLATIAVVPRERFSFAERSLATILTRTRGPYDLIYVDGNSPPPVKRAIEWHAAQCDFEVIRRDDYLSPNVARNLAAARVKTKYVAFIDNDVLVHPDWLQALLACAEETGAWLVGPLYCHGLPEATEIHMAAGKGRFVEHESGRRYIEEHYYYGKKLADVRHLLSRAPSDTIEFHAALVRMDVFEQLGPLDEAMLSLHDHCDLSMSVNAAGKQIFFEPSALVTYTLPFPLQPMDRDYFALRWCEAWNQISVDRFFEKWGLAPDDPSREITMGFGWWHRQRRCDAWRARMKAAGRAQREEELRPIIYSKEREHSLQRFPLDLCQPGGPYSGGRTKATLLHSPLTYSPLTYSPLTSAPPASTSSPPAPYRSPAAA
jgi:glycosyltransferase involved in cell wall biosynthesis